jgi:hypothetical protein
MDKAKVEDTLNLAQITLESIECVAAMLADDLGTVPEGPIANSLKLLASVASDQISKAFEYMNATAAHSPEVANG